jgi:hypothetical protein
VTPKKAPVRNGKERILDAAEQFFAQCGLCARGGPPPRPGKRVERRAQARGAAPDRAPSR